MLTQRQARQEKLILLTIEELIPKEHFLRKLDAAVDFSFIYDIVRPLYSNLGRPSIDPVILIKMLLIGYLYGIDSERKLEDEIRYNIAYRWFLGLDMDDPTPDHSTISQNRRRRFRGNEVFRQIFEVIVYKCMEAGLVKGENIVMDSTHIKANADNRNTELVQLTQNIDEYWLKLMDDYPQENRDPLNEYTSMMKAKNPCDPDAGYMNKSGKPKGFHYLAHQCSDADTGIIIDVEVTAGDVQDCECCVKRFTYLKQKGLPIKRAAMDKGYDTVPIHHGLTRLGIEAHISMCDRGNGRNTKDGKLSTEQFVFLPESEKYICPKGCALTFRGIHRKKGLPLKHYMASSKDCKKCDMQANCFKRNPNKNCARFINRAIHQEAREAGLMRVSTKTYSLMMRKRQIVCEGNFALQKRCHNLRFTRKRGQENVLEHSLLSASALNLKRLVWYGKQPLPPAQSVQMSRLSKEQSALFYFGQTQFMPFYPLIQILNSKYALLSTDPHCHRAIFAGIDYEFNDFIQAIHRIYRFMQKEKVTVDVIYTESEKEILKALMEKWKQHEHMTAQMISIIKKYGLSNRAAKQLERKMGVERVQVQGEFFKAVNNDCVEETRAMPENSVDMILTSIPFGNHYEYTANYCDFGHNEDTKQFFEQMDYLSPELLRVLRPGRVYACHVKDRVLFGNATGTGMPTMEPFHALCIEHYMKHGFQYFGMVTVVTDVVRENNQTYRLGWSEQCKDGTKMGVGCPEYILLFRKLPTDTSKAYADIPVSKTKEEYTRAQWQIDAHGYWRSSGDRLISKEELEAAPVETLQKLYRDFSRAGVYSYEDHVALAKQLDEAGKLPASFMVVAPGSWNDQVWDDINRMKTLNTTQSQRRQQLHVCPLQIDTVERLMFRYTNEGETILDPFAGLFTVPYLAIKHGRRGIGIELNPDYFRDGVGYCKAAEEERTMPTLFDLLEAAQ